MLRGLLIAGTMAAAASAAVASSTASSDAQAALTAFFAAADDSEPRKVDHAMASCLSEHAGGGQVRRLVKFAGADDKEAFLALMKRASARRPKLQDCLERAAFRAMFGG